MAQQISQTDSVLVSQHLKTTSLAIARHFGKRHDNVIRVIDNLDLPSDYHVLNFEETFRAVKGPNGATRQERFYEITRDGFSLLVMGFTGKKAMAWKVKFLEAFNMMEAELNSPLGVDAPVEYIAVPLHEWELLTRKARGAEVLQELDNQITAMRQIMLKGMDSMAYSPEMPLIRGIKQ